MITINDREQLDWKPGMTVNDVLAALGYSYALITVTLNGTLVEKEDYATTRVPDGAELTIFHLAHGG